jgi:hypothetical protein
MFKIKINIPKKNLLDLDKFYINDKLTQTETSFMNILGGDIDIIVNEKHLYRKNDSKLVGSYISGWLGYTLLAFLRSISKLENESKLNIDIYDRSISLKIINNNNNLLITSDSNDDKLINKINEEVSFSEFREEIFKASKEYLKIVNSIKELRKIPSAKKDIESFEKLINGL